MTSSSEHDVQPRRNTQTHPALLIFEIVRHFATFVESKEDLASLALTCHALSGPALDVLWAEPPSMLPLLLHLPDKPVEVLEEQNDAGVKRTVSLSRVFTTADWDTFLERARRVASLVQGATHCNESGTEVTYHDISPDVFRELCSAPSDTIFPRLKRLRWRIAPEYADHALPFLRMILKPTITFLDIDPCPISETDFLMSLEKMCPHLSAFSYRERESYHVLSQEGPVGDVETRIALRSRIIRSWNNVQSLKCGYLDLDALNHLASMKSFTTARIPLAPSITSLPFPPTSFQALQTLTTFAPMRQSLRIFTDFLKVTKIPFVNLHLGAGTIEDTALEDLIKALANSGHTDKMEALGIEEFTFNRNEGEGVIMPVIMPLLSFANLRDIIIDVLRLVWLDDADAAWMAQAWPRLERLSINMKTGWKNESGVTLRGLRFLVAGLPRLAELRIAIDASADVDGLGGFELAPGYGAGADCRAFRLDLLDSKIGGRLADVAACLADICRDVDLQLEDAPLAWGFEFVPPDLLGECILYQLGWKKVHELLYDATYIAWEDESSESSSDESDDEDSDDDSASG